MRVSVLCAALMLPVLASTAGADFTFVQVSDTHIGVNQDAHNSRYREVVRQINELKPVFVIHTGDALQDWSPENAALFKELSKPLTMPLYISPGNHDIFSLKDMKPEQATRAIEDWNREFGSDRILIEHDGCVFLGLNYNLWNTGLPEEKAQMDWLLSQSKKSEGKRIFIFQHAPLFLKTPSDPNGDYFAIDQPVRGELLKLCRTSKVEAVLSGHKHRFLDSFFDGTVFISTPATSFSCSEDPGLAGYRVFHVSKGGFTHRFVDLRR